MVTGYPASAFFADQRFWSDRIHPADRDRVFELYEEAVQTGREAAERASEQRLCETLESVALIEHASDVICVLAPDGTSLYESPSVERVIETSSGSSEPAAPSA